MMVGTTGRSDAANWFGSSSLLIRPTINWPLQGPPVIFIRRHLSLQRPCSPRIIQSSDIRKHVVQVDIRCGPFVQYHNSQSLLERPCFWEYSAFIGLDLSCNSVTCWCTSGCRGEACRGVYYRSDVEYSRCPRTTSSIERTTFDDRTWWSLRTEVFQHARHQEILTNKKKRIHPQVVLKETSCDVTCEMCQKFCQIPCCRFAFPKVNRETFSIYIEIRTEHYEFTLVFSLSMLRKADHQPSYSISTSLQPTWAPIMSTTWGIIFPVSPCDDALVRWPT